MRSKKTAIFVIAVAVAVIAAGAAAAFMMSSRTANPNFEDILLGNAGFLYISEGTAEPKNISDVPALFDPDDDYMKVWDFAVQDLDGDGSAEVILSVQGISGDTGGSLILHQTNDNIYGYPAKNREFSELKADGSFSYIDPTAVDQGGARSISGFTETGYTAEKVTRGSGPYPDAVWYEFTEENIKEIL